MGVMSCDRKGCDSVMCENISHERNEYICWKCKDELKQRGFCNVDEFMSSEPNERCSEAWNKYVDELFTSVCED